MNETIKRVEAHYTRGDLGQTLLDELRAAGKDVEALSVEDLAPVDEFHVRGREATVEVAELAGIVAADRVLDVGCGIGGPSRFLAARFGCRVTGLDLTEEYCRVAELLAARTGLADRVEYRRGDALAMPFDDARFDLVWTQHAAMNIADKSGLYAETYRVLKPGGRLALYDVLAGPGGGIRFPVPWAREPAISFLITPAALRAELEAVGFEIASWRDATAPAIDWFRLAQATAGPEDRPLSALRLLVGPAWREMAANMLRNLEDRRVVLVQAVASKA